MGNTGVELPGAQILFQRERGIPKLQAPAHRLCFNDKMGIPWPKSQVHGRGAFGRRLPRRGSVSTEKEKTGAEGPSTALGCLLINYFKFAQKLNFSYFKAKGLGLSV
jgi:hypothetical protein